MNIERILQVVQHYLLLVGSIGTVVALIWKTIPEARRQELERTYPRFANTMRLICALFVDVFKAVATIRQGIIAGQVKPPANQPPPTPPPTPSPPASERTTLDPPPPLMMLLVIASLGLAGCPSLPPPDGCTPRDQRCHEGAPQVCSPTQRWTPADQPCHTVQAVCCRALSPAQRVVHACVRPESCLPDPPSDAGSEVGAP